MGSPRQDQEHLHELRSCFLELLFVRSFPETGSIELDSQLCPTKRDVYMSQMHCFFFLFLCLPCYTQPHLHIPRWHRDLMHNPYVPTAPMCFVFPFSSTLTPLISHLINISCSYRLCDSYK